MTRYSVQPRDWIYVKGYWFLSFAKNVAKNIDKNISKNISSQYSKKRLDHAKQSATDALKTASKRAIQKTTGGLIGNKIADKITKISKTSQHNNSEIVTNEHDKEIPKERKISPEERRKIIDDLILIW